MADEIPIKRKDPDEKLDYTVNWATWLGVDTIASSVWAVDTGLTISSSPAVSNTTTTATAWVEGGTNKNRYKLTNTITTAAGRIKQSSFWIEIVTN